MSAPSERLLELNRIAVEAGAMAQAERARIGRELKADGSIVTNGDRAVELWLREQLPAFVPGTSVWGEEFGFEDAGAGGRWLVDPIDGTSNYAFGGPLWGVSIALEINDRLVMGAISLPDLGENYIAEDGGGAFRNGVRLAPIEPGPIRAHELTSYNDHVAARLSDVPGKQRLSGAFVIDGTFTVTGRFRALVGIREKLYDVAASVLLGREVGAEIRFVDGSPFDEKDHLKDEKIGRPWGILPRDCGWFAES